MAVNYYPRMRFATNLMPLLKAAGDAKEISRVLSILAAGSEGDIMLDDLGLKHNYTLFRCLSHCVVMTDFMVEEFAKRYPSTAFSHSYPGDTKTGFVDMLTGPARLAVKVMYAITARWILNFEESGERHLFQITSSLYPARDGNGGLPVPEGLEVVTGTDGIQGSGGYLLNWDGKVTENAALMRKYREQNAGPKVWAHTMEVFRKMASRKRSAEEVMESGKQSALPPAPNLAGWRPA